MNKVDDFIGSGIIKNYCHGCTNGEENKEVLLMASLYPLVRQEINKIKAGLSKKIIADEIIPSPKVKTSLMHRIYTQQSVIHKKFLPLMNNIKSFDDLNECINANNLQSSREGEDDIQVQELPSTNEIINIAAWVKNIQPEEIHHDMNEYIAIMEGSCDMYFGNTKRSYSEGEIIFIPPHVHHSAVITSVKPMFALVQRQLIAI